MHTMDKNGAIQSSYGFIHYFDRRSAALAILALYGMHLFGQPLKVNWAYASGQREDTSGYSVVAACVITLRWTDKTASQVSVRWHSNRMEGVLCLIIISFSGFAAGLLYLFQCFICISYQCHIYCSPCYCGSLFSSRCSECN